MFADETLKALPKFGWSRLPGETVDYPVSVRDRTVLLTVHLQWLRTHYVIELKRSNVSVSRRCAPQVYTLRPSGSMYSSFFHNNSILAFQKKISAES